MSHFYANIQGNRGMATRQGTKTSGIEGHIRGWDIGCRVTCIHRKGEDVCCVYLTSGSSGHKPSKRLGEFTVKDLD